MSDMRNDDPNFDVMGNFDHGLTLALSKGRILKETLPLLETAFNCITVSFTNVELLLI